MQNENQWSYTDHNGEKWYEKTHSKESAGIVTWEHEDAEPDVTLMKPRDDDFKLNFSSFDDIPLNVLKAIMPRIQRAVDNYSKEEL